MPSVNFYIKRHNIKTLKGNIKGIYRIIFLRQDIEKKMSSNFKMNDIEKLVAGIKTGLLKKYKTEEKASHTFIDGGKLYIPYEKLKKVYKELSTNLINPPLTERLGVYNDTFKFFIDVDDETANVERILEITEKYANQLFILDDKQKRYTVWKNSTKNK